MVQIPGKQSLSVRTSFEIILIRFIIREFQYHARQKRPKRGIFTSWHDLDVGKSA